MTSGADAADPAHRLRRSVGHKAVNHAAALAQLVGLTAIASRSLGAEAFGMWALVVAFWAFTWTASDMGSSVIATRIVARSFGQPVIPKGTAGDAAAAAGTVRLAVSLIVGAIAVTVAIAAARTDLAALLAIATAGTCLGALAQAGLVRAQSSLRFDRVVVIDGLGRVASLATLAAIVAGGGDSVFLAVAAATLVPGVWSAAASVLVDRRDRAGGADHRRVRPLAGSAEAVALVRDAWPYGAALLLTAVHFKADQMIIFATRGATELGVYTVGYRPFELQAALPAIIAVPLLAVLARLSPNRMSLRGSPLFRRATVAAGVAGILVAVASWLGAPLLTQLLGGREIPQATDVTRIIALAMPLSMLIAVFSTAELATGNQRRLLAFAAIAVGANVVLNVALIPAGGLIAAALVNVLSEGIMCALLAVDIFGSRGTQTVTGPARAAVFGPDAEQTGEPVRAV